MCIRVRSISYVLAKRYLYTTRTYLYQTRILPAPAHHRIRLRVPSCWTSAHLYDSTQTKPPVGMIITFQHKIYIKSIVLPYTCILRLCWSHSIFSNVFVHVFYSATPAIDHARYKQIQMNFNCSCFLLLNLLSFITNHNMSFFPLDSKISTRAKKCTKL